MAKNPFQGDDIDPFSGVRDEETGETAYKGPSKEAIERLEKRAEESKPQNFKQAFAAARKAGDKTFMFGGKKFTTELAKPTPKKDPDANKGPSKEAIERLEKRAADVHKEQARKKEDTQTGSERLARKAEAFRTRMREQAKGMKAGGQVKSSASKRADGCAVRGKTRGKMV